MFFITDGISSHIVSAICKNGNLPSGNLDHNFRDCAALSYDSDCLTLYNGLGERFMLVNFAANSLTQFNRSNNPIFLYRLDSGLCIPFNDSGHPVSYETEVLLPFDVIRYKLSYDRLFVLCNEYGYDIDVESGFVFPLDSAGNRVESGSVSLSGIVDELRCVLSEFV